MFETLEIERVGPVLSLIHISPAREGDTLEAEAIEQSQSGRTGVYDVTVRGQHGKTIALFRGKSYRISGEVIAGLQQQDAALTGLTPTI